jgi:prephenate dehydrogenase
MKMMFETDFSKAKLCDSISIADAVDDEAVAEFEKKLCAVDYNMLMREMMENPQMADMVAYANEASHSVRLL